jgi:hypothetical protein
LQLTARWSEPIFAVEATWRTSPKVAGSNPAGVANKSMT